VLKDSEQTAAFASKFINSTSCPVFLTGKAGTGKTTFLKEIVQSTHKNTIVAAPTGIAAINAGGVTLHSLFQLPFGSFIPSNQPPSQSVSIQLNTPKTLLRELQLNSAKRKMLQELELLIIDEVSMLRSDLLDAIDTILRAIRRQKNRPFGGVQILFIGDLLQLPPVVKEDEWRILSQYYPSPYFFDAVVLRQAKLIYLELEKIFRQTDQVFISILNRFRNKEATIDDINSLNKYYNPSFKPESNSGYINLVTHNRIADEINREALKRLPGKIYHFDATVGGDFDERIFPVEFTLELKPGAQVMFIKNDYSGEQRYFNGKIGKVGAISTEEITVIFDDGTPPAQAEPYIWENKRYTLDPSTNEIAEKIIGTFTHFPLKLAWAITVHKSQGLTFSKAVIDVSRAFAPGQVYVALSRLSSLGGLVLTAPIPYPLPGQDEALLKFDQRKPSAEILKKELQEETVAFISGYILQAFDFTQLAAALAAHIDSYDKDASLSGKQKFKPSAEAIQSALLPVKEVAERFLNQARQIVYPRNDGFLEVLLRRVEAANGYFTPIFNNLSKQVFGLYEIAGAEKRVKTYLNELRDVEMLFFKQLQQMHKSEALIRSALENTELTKKNLTESPLYKNREIPESGKSKKQPKEKKKKEKTDTKEITFRLFNSGKTIEEIAKERSLAISTIEGHLAKYVATGELEASLFIEKPVLAHIINKIAEMGTFSLSAIREALGNEVSYRELRFAVAAYIFQQPLKQESE